VARPGGRQPIVPGEEGLSIDALAAAARVASSSGIWRNSDRTGKPQDDDKELKRQRRKQSNRESARRSRLRKQLECESLHSQVRELSDENDRLRRQVRELREKLHQRRKESGQEKTHEEPTSQNGE